MVYRTRVALAGTSGILAVLGVLHFAPAADAPILALKPRTVYVHRTVRDLPPIRHKAPPKVPNAPIQAVVPPARYVTRVAAKPVQKVVKLKVRPATGTKPPAYQDDSAGLSTEAVDAP